MSIFRQKEKTLVYCGKLVLVKRKDHTGRNPAAGEAVKIPDETAVKMTVAEEAKEAIALRK